MIQSSNIRRYSICLITMDRVFKFMIYEEEKNMERHQYDKSTAVNLNKILESSSKNYE